ncbi:MAG: protein serine/threonine phosphatase [Paenibacillus sp.]|jgi:protein phosphatase|nr:protein serine/threonine phosphatase [Paenibacillus sp.]
MQSAHRTDTGLIRLINEDRAAVRNEWNGFTLAIVADGMGGHQAGEIASQMAIEQIESALMQVHTGMTDDERKESMRRAVVKANEDVFWFASKQPRYQGMGTTVVAVLATPETIIIGHIGDSRAYLLSGDAMNQLTEDHSLVNELIKSGQITTEEAHVHPLRNVVTRALGTDKQVEVDIIERSWKPGDMLLMCSDGLSGLVQEGEMQRIVAEPQSLDWKANKLVDRALEEGGSDNVTVVLLANVDNGEASAADDAEHGVENVVERRDDA